MFLKQIFLGVVGTGFGLFAAGGVITVLITVGLIPRFAGKMHVNRKVFLFEEMVVFGVIAGSFISVFEKYAGLGDWVLKHHLFGVNMTETVWRVAGTVIITIFGLFSGIFVGCLALAIAEMLDSIPIFARRTGFRRGLGIAILAVALGKVAGSLIYFMKAVYLYGG